MCPAIIRQISSGMSLPVMRGGASSDDDGSVGIIHFGTPFVLCSRVRLSGGERGGEVEGACISIVSMGT